MLNREAETRHGHRMPERWQRYMMYFRVCLESFITQEVWRKFNENKMIPKSKYRIQRESRKCGFTHLKVFPRLSSPILSASVDVLFLSLFTELLLLHRIEIQICIDSQRYWTWNRCFCSCNSFLFARFKSLNPIEIFGTPIKWIMVRLWGKTVYCFIYLLILLFARINYLVFACCTYSICSPVRVK